MSARTDRAGREPEHPLVGVIHSAEYLAVFHAWAERTGTWIEIKPWQRESDAAGIAKCWLTAALERDGVTLPELAHAVQHRGPELTR